MLGALQGEYSRLICTKKSRKAKVVMSDQHHEATYPMSSEVAGVRAAPTQNSTALLAKQISGNKSCQSSKQEATSGSNPEAELYRSNHLLG
jgi:hypothetical protein